MKRNSLIQSFARRDSYSWCALVLLVLGELFAFGGIHLGGHVWWLCTLCSIVLIVALCFTGNFNIRSVILTKLLANAIAPHKLGTIYLFLFVVHIGWLTNAAMSLFMPSDNLPDLTVSVVVCLVGLMVLIIFFPNAQYEKDENANEVIFSGMSTIMVPHDKKYESLNLRPLVRILHDKDLSKCELAILKSDYNKISDDKLSGQIREVLTFILTQPHQEPFHEEVKNIADRVCTLLDGKGIDDQLRTLIKEVTRKEFPDKEGIDDMKIDFSTRCDYNIYKSCYDALAIMVKEKDTYNNRLTFYISPGTVLVGSVITLMAIDGERKLYYYSQDKEDNDSTRLKFINKNEIPLRNLLSQALDTLEDNVR